MNEKLERFKEIMAEVADLNDGGGCVELGSTS